nr:PAS domain-containing protein [Polymorphobacter sp.]
MAIATVSAATMPLMLVEQDLMVLAVSDGFCRSFAIDRTVVPGRSIFALGSGEWATPLIRSLLTATMSGGADIDNYEVDLRSAARGTFRLRFDASMIHDDRGAGDLMLVAITDLGATRSCMRERDALKREKTVLLHALRRRTATSCVSYPRLAGVGRP